MVDSPVCGNDAKAANLVLSAQGPLDTVPTAVKDQRHLRKRGEQM